MAYRDRLLEAFRKGSMKDGTTSLWKTKEGRDSDGCEAVAEEVILDVLGWLDSDRDEEQVSRHWDAMQLIAKKAEERGLDLERNQP